jgi:16S rRNA (uracil1498-N3)-methyltransferase
VQSLAVGPLELAGDEAHYVRDVLRLRAGDTVALFDGDGAFASARIVEVAPESVRFEVDAPARQPAPACELTVALATPKGERADWAVEKLTELGVRRIVWLDCARGVVKPKAGGSRQERLERVAAAAAGQCGRADVPRLDGPLPFATALEQLEAASRFVADISGDRLAGGVAGSAVLLIGPEGGLTGQELVLATAAGYTTVRLSSWTLRVETAAAAGAAILLGS